jgi:hypothetical protein
MLIFTIFNLKKEIIDLGGKTLYFKYNNMYLLLSTVFPEYEWLPWKFTSLPPSFWDDHNNHKLFLNWAEKQLNINEKNDWYKISRKVLNIILFLNICKRRLPNLAAEAFLRSIVVYQIYYPLCFLVISGHHGNLNDFQRIIIFLNQIRKRS